MGIACVCPVELDDPTADSLDPEIECAIEV